MNEIQFKASAGAQEQALTVTEGVASSPKNPFEIKGFTSMTVEDVAVTTRVTKAPKIVDFGDRPTHLVEAQLRLEQDALQWSMDRAKAMREAGLLNLTNEAAGIKMVRDGFAGLTAAIKGVQDEPIHVAKRRASMIKFMQQFPAEELAILTLRALVAACREQEGSPLATVVEGLMTDVEDVDIEKRMEEQDPQEHRKFVALLKGGKLGTRTRRSIMRGGDGKYITFTWSDDQRYQTGVELLTLAMQQTKIAEERDVATPAKGRNITVKRIAPTEHTLEWVTNSRQMMDLNHPQLWPMVVRPLEWQGKLGGGYLTQSGALKRSLVIRSMKQAGQQETKGGQKVYAALNAIQSTAWCINSQVLEYIEEVGDFTPPEPHRVAFETPRQFVDALRFWQRERNNHVSQRLTVNAKREIARKFERYDAIYFPHVIDYRGRAYPMSSYVTPQADDMGKALLHFADAVPLGKEGLRWLAIHGANVFGVMDKAVYDDRVQWIHNHSKQIVDDAQNPRRAGAFWKTADSPFQALAFTFEWAALVEWIILGNHVETFQSRLPVGMDGSCNGLQHYSAILRDEVGGGATNLLTNDKPSDIYALVATEVMRTLEIEMTSDDEGSAAKARWWYVKGVTRKLTKRNTMTLPYGVTRRGMSEQLWAELGGTQAAVQYCEGAPAKPREMVNYLAAKNWDATGVVVRAAQEAMAWLKDSTRTLHKAGVTPQWTTLDGLKVQQAYAVQEKVEMQLRGKSLKIRFRRPTEQISGAKQALGIAPNFVHSIDATHMRMVTLELAKVGITDVAMIHDSFGCHAGNVEAMQRITRERFVCLHSTNLLEKIRGEFQSLLPADHDPLPPVPRTGSLDLNAVLGSDYFFA